MRPWSECHLQKVENCCKQSTVTQYKIVYLHALRLQLALVTIWGSIYMMLQGPTSVGFIMLTGDLAHTVAPSKQFWSCSRGCCSLARFCAGEGERTLHCLRG